MKIGFVGLFSQPSITGEISDETHLAREMEALGHQVYRIPRDEWREYIVENFPKGKYVNVPEEVTFDIAIICKWHHFYGGVFIRAIREKYKCPVFYWLWDYMFDAGFPEWHLSMAQESDLYLTNEYGIKSWYQDYDVAKLYYFPFDVADQTIVKMAAPKKYDVTFFGSKLGQGDRVDWLREINRYHPVKVFAWNFEEWQKEGFDAEQAVYGQEFAQKVAESKIMLGFSVNPSCWGYWSNRVGKVLTLGGFLLYQYAPGMELFLRDGIEYFSSPQEAIEKIDHYLIAEIEREAIALRGYMIGLDRFTSKARVKELMILIDRFLKTKGIGWHH